MTSKTKKRKIYRRTTSHGDDAPPVEDCGRLMEKWKELLQDFCGEDELGGVTSDHLLNNDKFKLLTSTRDPDDDLDQFLESIGALESRETTPSNKTGSDTELLHGDNNNKKNDNNNNDCSKNSQAAEEEVGHFAGEKKLRFPKREGDQSIEEKEADNKLKLDGPHSLFKNSVVISRFKMTKLKETLIESEQTIRKLLELKKPRSAWEGICGQEVNNIFTEKPKPNQEKITSPAEGEKETKVTKPFDDNNNRSNLSGVLSSDRLTSSFNFRVKNRNRKVAKGGANKSIEKVYKQDLKRPEDEAKVEILISGSHLDVCDGSRNSNLRTRVTSYENFLETENISDRHQALKSQSKSNFSKGDFNFSNCCNTRNVQSCRSDDAQNDRRGCNHHQQHNNNRRSTNALSVEQPFGELEEKLAKEPIGNCGNLWKNVESQNNCRRVDYTSSDCSECFSSGGRSRKAKSKSKTCQQHLRSVGTTMNTSVHEEPTTQQPPLKSFGIASSSSRPLSCCRNSFQRRPSHGVANDDAYDECGDCYSNLNDGRMSNGSSGRHGKRNFSQNYEYCSLCEGQCRDSEFVAVLGKEDKVWLERGELNKYWKETAVQTDDLFQGYPKNCTLCYQNDPDECRNDSKTSTTQDKNNSNNNKKNCCLPRCQSHLSLECHPTKASYSSASSSPGLDTKTFAGQTDIIDLIDEVTSEEVIKQSHTRSATNPTMHTTGQHSGAQESNHTGFANSEKTTGLRRRQPRHDEVCSSGLRIVRAIEDELQGIKPYVSKVNRAAATRLASRELNKISDFLNNFTDNKCNNI